MKISTFYISWLYLLNILFFQWFFFRLTKCEETKVENFTLLSIDLMPNGGFSHRGHGKKKTYTWYSFQYWILPLSGWNKDFIFINEKPRFYRLTKEIIKK